MNYFFAVLFLFPVALASTNCEFSADGIMEMERNILAEVQKSGTPDQMYQRIRPSFKCLLKIQQEGGGILKTLATAALRPLLGGTALRGTRLDSRHQKVAKVLENQATRSRDLLAENARGQWGYYDLFCGSKDQSQCTLFLPDERQMKEQSALHGASSILLLKSAYQSLKGKPREEVAQQIRNLHIKITDSEPLKKLVIDEIYQELFPDQVFKLGPLT